MDIVAELTLTPRGPKCHSDLPVKIGTYDEQSSFSSGLLNDGPNEAMNPSCGYFPVLECIIRIDMFSNWQDPHVGFLTCVVSNIWMRDQERGVQEVGLWGEHCDVIKDREKKKSCRNQGKVSKVLLEWDGSESCSASRI